MWGVRHRLVAACVCVAAILSASPASHADEGVLRIMPSGDSLTQGIEGDRTWRFWLDQHLTTDAVPHDFVGNIRRTASLDMTSNDEGYRPGIAFDTDHDGWGGAELLGSEDAFAFRLWANRPNVWILQLGTNDIRYGNADAQDLLAASERAIATARKVNPSIRIVLVTVLLMPDPNEQNPVRSAFNDGLVSLAQSLSTAESPVTVARTDLAVDPRYGTHDGVHLNAQGEYDYAAAICVALAELGHVAAMPAYRVPGDLSPVTPAQLRKKKRTPYVSWPHVFSSDNYRLEYRPIRPREPWRTLTTTIFRTQRVARALRESGGSARLRVRWRRGDTTLAVSATIVKRIGDYRLPMVSGSMRGAAQPG
ncbi:MAG: GDSL-type esterase/lipase family protein [Candidatus Nanopelagicales bacterium]|nr:GDSL-type esterase/lipase family protein [Candidatus Nanopelagicales bacterium]